MSTRQAGPVSWQVNGLQLAGLSWGEAGQRPVLALHGWLDNAASFSLLGPLLANCHVVALDLTGHGRSAHRSADATYQIWDDLPEIEGVLDALGWERFCLLGHSRGAIIASLLAAAVPERVQSLVLLDAVAPPPVAESEFAQQLRRFLDDKRRWQAKDARVFPTLESAINSRTGDRLEESLARLLVERNLVPCEGGLRLTTDPRLRGASAVKLSAGQIQAALAALTMPTLLLLAQDGFAQRPELADLARRHIPALTLETHPGGHHFHMESGVAMLARRLEEFFESSLH